MSYSLPTALPAGISHPAQHLHKLLRLPEFEHLKAGEARIEFLMRGHEQIFAGRRVLGTCHLPRVQGRLKDVFIWMLEEKFGELPDFLIELDMTYWLDEAGEREREILIYHELMHADQAVDKFGTPRFDQEGRPTWRIRGHDVEEFSSVVRRYGSWSDELRAFIASAEEGNLVSSS